MRSFFSEHTAEFFLVPRLRSILIERFDTVVPVYFWKTREGNLLSREIHSDSVVRLFAMFPRRPKLLTATSQDIHGKINAALFEFAGSALRLGIPTIAGLPLARSLVELCKSSMPLWINLKNNAPKDITFKVSIDTRTTQVVSPQSESLEVVDESKISSLVENEARSVTWSEALDVIGELRTARDHDDFISRFFFMGGYKPIYFLIFNHP